MFERGVERRLALWFRHHGVDTGREKKCGALPRFQVSCVPVFPVVFSDAGRFPPIDLGRIRLALFHFFKCFFANRAGALGSTGRSPCHASCHAARNPTTQAPISWASAAVASAVAFQWPGQLSEADCDPPCLVLGENVCLQCFGFVGSAKEVHQRLSIRMPCDVATRDLLDVLFF